MGMACGRDPRYDLIHHQKLNGNRRKLQTQLADYFNELIERLREKGGLQKYEFTQIQNTRRNEGPEAGISKLIDCLCDRDVEVYNIFKECLIEMGLKQIVVDLLEDGGSGSQTVNDPITASQSELSGNASGAPTRSHTELSGHATGYTESRNATEQSSLHTVGTITRHYTEQSVYAPAGPVSRSHHPELSGQDTGNIITRSHTEHNVHDAITRQNTHLADVDKADVRKCVLFGRMREPHYSEIWIPNNENLVKDFKNHLGDVMGKLFQAFIINDDDKTTINGINDNVDAARKLVDILAERGENVLGRIIKALKPKYDIAKRLDVQFTKINLHK
ncbi:uncharacterized protein LOC126825496 [Patella vulgata]|uniref:uncharacterized protein LOC126825496 n=1 Tax=Patella vulgata TaxID=6465 RepID=UPI0021809544|nr:uncharacterized protein LOC126825496 [Patella vulgata]